MKKKRKDDNFIGYTFKKNIGKPSELLNAILDLDTLIPPL